MRQYGFSLLLAGLVALGQVPLAQGLGLDVLPGGGAAMANHAGREVKDGMGQADRDGEGRGRAVKDHGDAADDPGGNGKGHVTSDAADPGWDSPEGDELGDGLGDGFGQEPVDPDDGSWDGSTSDDYVAVDDEVEFSVQDGDFGQGPTEADPGVAPVSLEDGEGGVVNSGDGSSVAAEVLRKSRKEAAPAFAPGATPAAPPRVAPRATAAGADGKPRAGLVLVELFTSEGCTACPPAESLLGELSHQPGVLALSLHVDYWDYLGWTDAYAQARFTSRQRAYARRDGARSVFTPQLVIGGVAGASAPRPAKVAREVARQAGAQDVAARVAEVNGRQRVTLTVTRPLGASAEIVVARALPQVDVEIRGGENRGRSVRHINVVRDWDVVAAWDGSAPIVLDVATAAARGRGELVALIVQERLPGPGGSGLPGKVLTAIRLE